MTRNKPRTKKSIKLSKGKIIVLDLVKHPKSKSKIPNLYLMIREDYSDADLERWSRLLSKRGKSITNPPRIYKVIRQANPTVDYLLEIEEHGDTVA